MNEAVKMSIAEHGEIEFDTAHRESINNAEYIEQWYKENLTKYIKTLKWEVQIKAINTSEPYSLMEQASAAT